ncbi:SusC/RagA family TonB-linked outer membrane protein (plasmid) [Fulvitalea axinellae]|uniref:SusC/RagA family TonB-linked outer membrane protein n=1 Tax=Fulvitalea axinellae TaxID=1182444 RepID=A0AAU9D8C8_9BACT|nr:SusC/RagA family TonB-linked outer membrane protein [Fulvitalea axinellae]
MVKPLSFLKSKKWLLCTGIYLGCSMAPAFPPMAFANGERSEKPQQTKKTVRGKVLDENGEGLPGATVSIQSSGIGVATGLNGEFSLEASGSDIIVFKFIGYQDVTRPASALFGKEFSIRLEPEAKLLKDVVVTGFQEVDRKLFTGAAAFVSMKDVKIEGVPDASRMLEGRVAGVSVDNVSGSFGTAPRILIRGNASLNGSNKPLWVVDGVVVEDIVEVSSDDLSSGDARTLISSSIAGLNPDDIASFEVLKDASATALYGARAMNGVIAVTTKRGKSGRTSVNYSGSYSLRRRPHYGQFNIMNSQQEMSVYRDLVNKGWIDATTAARAKNFGVVGKMYDLIAKKQIPWDYDGLGNNDFLRQYEGANTDWFDLLFKDSFTQQHSVSLTSGNEKSRYYVSLGYLNDNGQTVADEVERYTLSTRADFNVTDKFDVGINLTGSIRDQKAPGTTSREFNAIDGTFTREFDINPLGYALNTARSMRPYDSDGELEYFRRNYAPFNIINELNNNYLGIDVMDLSLQADLKYAITDNLKISSTLQYRRAATRREHRIKDKSNQAEAYRANSTQIISDANQYLFTDPDKPNTNPQSILPSGGFYNLSENILDSYYVRNLISWDPKIGDAHEFAILAGQEIRLANRQESGFDGWGFQYERGGVVVTNPQAIRANVLNGNDYFDMREFRDRFMGLFFSAGYTFRQKYMLNFTTRYDGSNQLGKTNKSRFFPTWNVSGAWNISEEGFMESVDWIDRLKVKATYGLSGSMGPLTAAELDTRGVVPQRPTIGDRETVLAIQNLANEDLTWEKLNEFNAGVEFDLFQGRIGGGVEFYQRRSHDLIGYVETSGIGGQGNKLGNRFDMDSHGIELTLNATPLEIGDFSWATSVTWGYNKNEITSLDLAPTIASAVKAEGDAMLGKARRGLYSVRYAGLNNQGIPTFYGAEGKVVQEIYLQDRIDEFQELTYEGSVDPIANGGWVNSFRYGRFSLMVNITYRYGNKIRLNDLYPRSFDDFSALPKEFADRWALPGDEAVTDIPAIVDRRTDLNIGNAGVNPFQLYNKSDIRVADGSFVRLKNVTVSYTLSPALLERLGLRTGKISLQGNNLALLYSDDKLNGQDPEFFNSGGVALPVPTMYTMSVNFGF